MAEGIEENELKHIFGVLGMPKELKVTNGKYCACFTDIMKEKLEAILINP